MAAGTRDCPDLYLEIKRSKNTDINFQRLMIYRRHLFSMLNSCNEIENTLLEILNLSPTREEKEFVRDIRAHLHDMTEVIKEQDY